MNQAGTDAGGRTTEMEDMRQPDGNQDRSQPDGKPQGILPSHRLREAWERGEIDAGRYTIPGENFQPASLDLRLGPRAYRLRCSFLPHDGTVSEKMEEHVMDEMDIRDGAILERERPYLIPLTEELYLPEDVHAFANPRSSTGRLDIFTRVITDRSGRFDQIAAGHRGKMYLEVASRSFTVRAREGISLNQVRLIRGNHLAGVHSAGAREKGGGAIGPWNGPEAFLSVDLSGDGGQAVGYKARKNSRLLDLTAVGAHAPGDFWEPVTPERGGKLVLEPEEFYLLMSREAVTVPPGFAAEMSAYNPTSGELRTHYAGFFDPGFGHDPEGKRDGARAVLEVRAHDVPFMIEHGQPVSRLEFQNMAEEARLLYGKEAGSHYQHQELTLSRHFIRK